MHFKIYLLKQFFKFHKRMKIKFQAISCFAKPFFETNELGGASEICEVLFLLNFIKCVDQILINDGLLNKSYIKFFKEFIEINQSSLSCIA